METEIKSEPGSLNGKRVKLKIVERVKRGPDVPKTEKSEVRPTPTTKFVRPEHFSGPPEKKVELEFKFYLRKRQKKASYVWKLKSTVGELNQKLSGWFDFFGIYSENKDYGKPYSLYLGGGDGERHTIKRVMDVFLDSNRENQIPKKYHWSADMFSLDVYDTLLCSNVPMINTRRPDRW